VSESPPPASAAVAVIISCAMGTGISFVGFLFRCGCNAPDLLCAR
jgi:hypothetical protein